MSNNFPGVALRFFLSSGGGGESGGGEEGGGHGDVGLALSPALQAVVYGVVLSLPWNLKILVAFLSDCVPLWGGQRRRPYLVVGLLLQALGWWALALAGGTLSSDGDDSAGWCSPLAVSGLLFAATMGQVTVGVMCDAFVVENMAHERGERQVGALQSSCWITLNGGTLVGMLAGGTRCGTGVPGWACWG